jgi:hypothetical protein
MNVYDAPCCRASGRLPAGALRFPAAGHGWHEHA